jgi:hypothetical protein
MVALYYGVVPTKVRKTPRDLAQTSIYATLHQHRTLRCGGERRRRRVSGAFRTNHRRAMGELYQVKGDGPNQPGPDGAPVHRRQGVVHPRTRGILTDEYMHGGTIGTTINHLVEGFVKSKLRPSNCRVACGSTASAPRSANRVRGLPDV